MLGIIFGAFWVDFHVLVLYLDRLVDLFCQKLESKMTPRFDYLAFRPTMGGVRKNDKQKGESPSFVERSFCRTSLLLVETRGNRNAGSFSQLNGPPDGRAMRFLEFLGISGGAGNPKKFW